MRRRSFPLVLALAAGLTACSDQITGYDPVPVEFAPQASVSARPYGSALLIEGFESGHLDDYVNSSSGSVSSAYAHDGAFGLGMNGANWLWRDDTAVHVQQGDVISTWIMFDDIVGGRAYFGFGASSAGALSFVLAPNTGNIIFQANDGYGFADLTSSPQSFIVNQWYRAEVVWGVGGSLTGNLYASDGTTLLNSITTSRSTPTQGGLAFRGFSGVKAFDTIELLSATPVDDTPPTITPTVTGTEGNNGYYVSDVVVSFTVVEDESTATLTGCDTVLIDADTNGTTLTCTAESEGGSASASVTVLRDATDPTVGFSGNAGSYDAADQVTLTCSAGDATSGLASVSCVDVDVPGYEIGVGSHTLTASAEDLAGNASAASATFVVSASFDGTCALVNEFVQHRGIANSLCQKLSAAAHSQLRGRTAARDGQLAAFVNEVEAQRGKKIDAAHADVLVSLAGALGS